MFDFRIVPTLWGFFHFILTAIYACLFIQNIVLGLWFAFNKFRPGQHTFFLLLTESVFSHSENLLIQEKYVISEFNIRCMFIFGSLECFLIWTWIDRFFDFWNATFSNISAISWRPVLVVEEAGVPGENQRPCASNWQALSLAAASRVHLFCNLQSQARAHTVLVIGLYELLGNPTT